MYTTNLSNVADEVAIQSRKVTRVRESQQILIDGLLVLPAVETRGSANDEVIGFVIRA